MNNDQLLQELEALPPDQQAALLESLMSTLSEAAPPPPTEYRVYYNPDGSIITYTMQAIPGDYITITADQYAQGRHDARVLDGQLVFTHRKHQVFKLERNSTAGYKVSKYDVCIPVSDDEEHNLLTTRVYEIVK
jgi:hypothetical protein